MRLSGGWQHFSPVRVLCKADALDQLGTGFPFERPLLVTTPGSTRRGVTARVQTIIGDRLRTHDAVKPNPDLDELDAVADRLRTEHIDGIIALGGGSALDSGKALAACLASPGEGYLNAALRLREAQLPQHCLPLIAVPTTSGTGSEVTPFATVWDGRNHRKHSLVGEQLLPRVALLDPTLTLTLPRQETLYSGLDCISHALETLWNRRSTPISEGLALHALRIAVEALPALLEDLDALDERVAMQNASLLAGIAISQNQTALAHSMSYPLTSHFCVPHGLAASFSLPALIDLVRERNVWPGSDAKWPIVERARELLAGLQLHREIARFVDIREAVARLPEMFTQERTDSFVLNVDCHAVDLLLQRALRAPVQLT